MKPRPVHVKHKYFSAESDELKVNGKPITMLAAQVGQTPFYCYDRSVINKRIAELRELFPEGFNLHFAMKANPMPAVVNHIAPLVDGLDVASAREMQVALDAGMAPHRISMAGPGKSEEELRRCIAAGIIINVESPLELTRIHKLAANLNTKSQVAIRVNPDFELKSSGMKMGGGPKQFGIDAEEVPTVLKSIDTRLVEFIGFHIFSGSQNLKPDAIIESQQKALALAVRLSKDAPSPVKKLNLGGGFGIPYFPGEPHLDTAPLGENLANIAKEASKLLPEATLVLELGRYIIGEAGIYVCKVQDKKVSREHTYLVTDGGLHHHLAASGNFGQVIRKNYPVLTANKANKEKTINASVVGPLCTPLDLLGDKVDLPDTEVGDLIAVLQSGAYGLTASPEKFLSHPSAVEILV